MNFNAIGGFKISDTQTNITSIELNNRTRLRRSKPLVYEKVMKYEEKLGRGESVAIIQLQYDYRCNFKCQHCAVEEFRNLRKGRSFTLNDIRKLARQADEMGLGHVNISGGEPLKFSDLSDVIKAFSPEKFYMQCDTNGWLMTDDRARYLKSIGVDRMQVSIDSLDAEEHDKFRRQPGSHERAVRAIDSMQKAGLEMQIATVVTKQRLRTTEFINFLEFAKSKNAPVSVIWPKPVGAWEGNFDGLVDEEDLKYFRELGQNYNVYDHLTTKYGLEIGCVAVKRSVNITKWGDVLPCCYMYLSLGNVFEEPLSDILARGMEYFGGYTNKCLMSQDRDFLTKHLIKTYGREKPVPIEEIIPPDVELYATQPKPALAK